PLVEPRPARQPGLPVVPRRLGQDRESLLPVHGQILNTRRVYAQALSSFAVHRGDRWTGDLLTLREAARWRGSAWRGRGRHARRGQRSWGRYPRSAGPNDGAAFEKPASM